MRIALFTETFLPKVDGIVNTLCQLLEHLAGRGREERLCLHPAVARSATPARVYTACEYTVPALPRAETSATARKRCQVPARLRARHHPRGQSGHLRHHRSAPRTPAGGANHRLLPYRCSRYFQALGVGPPATPGDRVLSLVAQSGPAESVSLPGHLPRAGGARVQTAARVGARVDSERFHPGRRSAAWRQRLTAGASDKPLLLYVGRLSPEKRIDWLKPVLQAVPEARLAIVGDGPLRPALERQFAGLPVCFTGYLTGAELAHTLRCCGHLCFPSPQRNVWECRGGGDGLWVACGAAPGPVGSGTD